ncbi:MAG: menaquinone biosynthesis protein [Bacteroidetes bacterium]|nr:menaquinone biosynthesis protein [Bacteroidota bacterium]
MYKVSIVNYTNTLPFKWALKKSSFINSFDLQEDIPSICAQKLKYNQVDLALVPVALINELSEYYIYTDYCIGANAKVDSVKLYSTIELNKIKTITLDYQSKTSVALAKILCKFHWNISPTFLDALPGFEKNITVPNAAVVIGDRTFAMNGNFKYEFDLAEAWYEMTKMPFTFAAWVSTKPLNLDFISQFNSILEEGVKNIETAVNDSEKELIISKVVALNYLQNRIDLRLTKDKKEAINLFLSYLKQI